MANDDKYIELEDFDREYGIDDLLSASLLEELFSELQKVKSISYLILMPDGTSHYTKGVVPEADMSIIQKALSRRFDTVEVAETDLGKISIYPISHELETIGYFVSVYERKGEQLPYEITHLDTFILTALIQLIRQNHRYLMTSGLHGQVVEESYVELKQKAALLEKSEKKYRLLAENLEVEVQKKTKEIKEVQIKIMQQEKMASIGQLSAGVAHEINNPMGFISSNLINLESYVKDNLSLIERYRDFVSNLKKNMDFQEGRNTILKELEKIRKFESEIDIDFILEDTLLLLKESHEGAERIKEIVIDLKDFAHPGIETPESVDINRNLNSTLNMVAYELKHKATVKKIYGDLPRVKCIHQKLNQVFMNILLNAAQAINDKGEITIVTKTVDGYVMVEISDTGSGIPEEHLPKIFDPFFTTRRVGEGTGLGLHQVYNILKEHNGSIDVHSTVGTGSTFTIRLPVE